MLKKTLFQAMLLAFVCLFMATESSAYAMKRSHTDELRQYLENSYTPSKKFHKRKTLKKALVEFYTARNFKPVWFNKGGAPLINIRRFNNALANHAYHNGINPDRYNLKDVRISPEAMGPFSLETLLEQEIALTEVLMRYVYAMKAGVVNLRRYDPIIFLLPQNENLSKSTASVLRESHNPTNALKALEPQQKNYQALKAQLEKYRTLKRNGGWDEIDLTPHRKKNKKFLITPNKTHPIIPFIRARIDQAAIDGALPEGVWIDEGLFTNRAMKDFYLSPPAEPSEQEEASTTKSAQNGGGSTGSGLNSAGGDLPPQDSEDLPETAIEEQTADDFYDDELVRKVMTFQYFYGQKTDGVIGLATIRALNLSAQDHIDQITLSLERWRWLPDTLGDKHVFINIPGYYAQAVSEGKTDFIMPVIVGEAEYPTPVFSSHILNVKIHPEWTSPRSISQRYVIPKIQENPDIIDRLGYEIQYTGGGRVETIPWDDVDIDDLHETDLSQYRFRQKPGHANALGLARFSIRNRYAIFMHGTPSQYLFDRNARALSSGCVRLQDPFKMASFLLKDHTKVTQEELSELYHLEKGEEADTTYIKLMEEVPVYLTYSTSWVDEQGHMHFSNDIYDRNAALLKALN